MVVERDVIVDVNAGLLPFGVDISFSRQW